MKVVFWILLTLFIVIAAYASIMVVYLRRFSQKSKLVLGTLVGQEMHKKGKGFYPVVQFRANKHLITAKAMAFDKKAVLMQGQKVSIRYLETGAAPQKWDIRIVGKEGYGKKHTMKIAALLYGIAVVFLASAIIVQFAM